MASMYIPVQKINGRRYPAITAEDKAWYENPESPAYNKYTFEEVKDKTPLAPAPTEAKQVLKEEK